MQGVKDKVRIDLNIELILNSQSMALQIRRSPRILVPLSSDTRLGTPLRLLSLLIVCCLSGVRDK